VYVNVLVPSPKSTSPSLTRIPFLNISTVTVDGFFVVPDGTVISSPVTSTVTENQGESLAVHGGDESDSADTFGMLNECFKCLHIV
jgi:hypothetical protein